MSSLGNGDLRGVALHKKDHIEFGIRNELAKRETQ